MPIIDLAFHLTGDLIPADHGYSLYSAVSRHVPDLHDEDSGDGRATTGIHAIGGTPVGDRTVRIDPRRSRLTVRIPCEVIAKFLPLAGKALRLGIGKVQIGVPEIKMLCDGSALHSRLVVIKGATEADTFLDALRRQLDQLGITATASLSTRGGSASLEGNPSRLGRKGEPMRRTVRVKDKELIGFAVLVSELKPADSVLLQEHGLGGRRHFGCGIFLPRSKRGID